VIYLPPSASFFPSKRIPFLITFPAKNLKRNALRVPFLQLGAPVPRYFLQNQPPVLDAAPLLGRAAGSAGARFPLFYELCRGDRRSSRKR
jgi:hypothetical protein